MFGDPAALGDVVQNLITNTVKHARQDRPPRVWIRGGEVGDRMGLTVADDGPGIAPDPRDRALQMFARIDGSSSGAGLGLAICQRIAQAHGGDLRLEEAPEGGLAVTLELPAETSQTHP